jgi:hypothetical protein
MDKFKLTLETKGRIFYDYEIEAKNIEDALNKLNNGEVEFTGKPRIEEYDLDPQDVIITDNDTGLTYDGYGDSLDGIDGTDPNDDEIA